MIVIIYDKRWLVVYVLGIINYLGGCYNWWVEGVGVDISNEVIFIKLIGVLILVFLNGLYCLGFGLLFFKREIDWMIFLFIWVRLIIIENDR